MKLINPKKPMSKNKEVCEIGDNDFFIIYRDIEKKKFRKRDLFALIVFFVILVLSVIYIIK